ncbi:MAG: PAS domain S-box protein, partial [Thermoanaerobaculia bacterium]
MAAQLLLAGGGGFSGNGLAWATLLTAVIIFLLGFAVLLHTRVFTSFLFFLSTVATTGWFASFAFMYAAPDERSALLLARLGHFCSALIPAAVFHFAANYVGKGRTLRTVARIFWIVCLAIGLIGALTPLFTRTVHKFGWGYYPVGSLTNLVWVLVLMGILFAAMSLLWMAYRDSEGKMRERNGALLLALLLASLGVVDYLPTLGVDIYPVGYMALLSFVVVSASAAWNFRFVDLTPAFAASQILETMKSAVLLVDMEGRIRVVNHASCELLGYSQRDLIGMHIRNILAVDKYTSTGKLLNNLGVLEQNMMWRGANGSTIAVLASSSIVRDANEGPVAVVYVASDYTERKRAEELLRDSEQRYRTLFDSNPLPMWIYDFETLRFVAVNEAAVQHYGYSRNELMSMKITEIRPEEDVPSVMSLLPGISGRRGPNLFRHRKKDGTVIDVDITSFEFVSGGRRTRLVIAQDVTERRRNEDVLRRSEQQYRLLFERNLAGVYRTTAEGRILDCNEAMAHIFGYESREQLLAQTAWSLYFDDNDRQRALLQLREQKSMQNLEFKMRRRDNKAIWVLENVSLLEATADGEILEGTIIDITEQKTAREQMEFQAYHDILTSLPNRLLFRDRIGIALAHARRTGRSAAVMFLDLDQFKMVNDTLGHPVGDRLLQSVAFRLVNCVRAEDTVARLGGDEFTILLADVADRRAAAVVAQKVLDAVRLPCSIDDHELLLTTSIGISLFPDDGTEPETLLRNADRAMYRAKEMGRNNYQYATAMISGADQRATMQRSLQRALEEGEFIIHYQPMVEVATNRIVGAEALVRWMHPEHGLMNPDEFIPAAEETQFIVPLGEWVLRTACVQMKAWHDAGQTDLRVSVNLSPRQFQQRDLVAMVETILEE